jgi:hypothetical protein
MKPYVHSKISARKYGGIPEDYLPIHDMMDISKMCYAHVRHRAIFHNALGPFIMEKIFGTNITNSDNKLVSVRDIAEDHIIEDCGRIPTVEDWLKDIPFKPWMAGGVKIHMHENTTINENKTENKID